MMFFWRYIQFDKYFLHWIGDKIEKTLNDVRVLIHIPTCFPIKGSNFFRLASITKFGYEISCSLEWPARNRDPGACQICVKCVFNKARVKTRFFGCTLEFGTLGSSTSLRHNNGKINASILSAQNVRISPPPPCFGHVTYLFPPNPIFTLIQLGFLPNFKRLVKIRETGVTKGRSPLCVQHCTSRWLSFISERSSCAAFSESMRGYFKIKCCRSWERPGVQNSGLSETQTPARSSAICQSDVLLIKLEVILQW